MSFNIENVKIWINEKNLDIQYGETLEDKDCLVANWNEYEKLENMFETMNKYGYDIELLWSDTYQQCSSCYKYFDGLPAYYGDQSNTGIWVSDCDYLCPDCALEYIDDIIEYHKNSTDFAAPSWMIETLKEKGFLCLDECKIYENGFHPGQNDNPVDIAKQLDNECITGDYDFLFALTDIGQFDVHFIVLIRSNK